VPSPFSPEATDKPGVSGLLPPGEARLDLRVHLRTIRKRWLAAVLIAGGLVGGVFAWTYRQPKIYEATCSIVIESMAPQVLQGVKDVVELGTGSFWANREFYETQYRIIRSKDIAQRVADRLGLTHDVDYPVPGAGRTAPAGKRDLSGALIGQTRVAPVKDSRIANIIVTDRNPQRAALIANAFAETYIEANLEYKLEGTSKATGWLGEQVVDLRKKLEASEMRLYDFKKEQNLLAVSLDDKQSMTSQNLQHFNQKLADLRAKRLELDANRKLIMEAQGKIEEQESLPEIRQNMVIQQLRTTFIELSKLKADLESRYGDKHPKIDNIGNQLAAVTRDYQSEIGKVLKSADKAYQAVVENEKSLVKLMEREKQEAIEIAKVEATYKPLARDAENNAKVYGLIAQRQKETDLTGLMRTNNVRVLDRAIAVGRPIKPNMFVNLAVALALGLVLGIASTFVIEIFDNTLKTQEDVEQVIGVPVLGVVPIIGDAAAGKRTDPVDLKQRDMGVFRDPKSSAAECCRSIRTNLLFMSPDRPIRTMVVTSPGPQEGKTTTAINLGITMAQAGSRVLLVDTDMRRPRLHRSFGVPNEVGASSFIVGEAALDDAIKRTEVPNLDVLPCGPTPPNPAELLHTDRFAKLLDDCKARYDLVILDSPPTSAVTDPAIIGNKADGVVLVVRGGYTTRDAGSYARRQLADAKARLLGAVVNQVDLTGRGYGTYYYYYRSYARYGRYYGKTDEEGAKA